jgi:hypothetical protein
MVIRQAGLVVPGSLVRGARCVRSFGHVTSWACFVFAGHHVRRCFLRSLSSPLGGNLATQSFNILSRIRRVEPLVRLRTMRSREQARSRQRCGCLTTCKSPVAQQGPSGAVAPLGQNTAWTVRCRGSVDSDFARQEALNLNHRTGREQRLPDLRKIQPMASGR